MGRLARCHFTLLRQNLNRLSAKTRGLARTVLDQEREVLARFQALAARPLKGRRIRCHGDLHLGQVLRVKNDFVFIDFEGEPSRSLKERREKQSPLKDLAGMLRSFHYAEAFHRHKSGWQGQVSRAFLDGYWKKAGKAAFLPLDRKEQRVLLDAFMLEKAVYELGYELNFRPGWVGIPLEGMIQILQGRHYF